MKKTVSMNILAGAIGGAVASLAMNQFQALMSAAETQIAKQQGGNPEKSSGGDDATVRTAKAISGRVFDHNLTRREKKWAGPLVHYAFGTLAGALYGLMVETVPAAQTGRGTLYGSAVWLGADEVGVPAFGLTPPASKTPASGHAKALASHLVYGFTTDLVRRTIMKTASAS